MSLARNTIGAKRIGGFGESTSIDVDVGVNDRRFESNRKKDTSPADCHRWPLLMLDIIRHRCRHRYYNADAMTRWRGYNYQPRACRAYWKRWTCSIFEAAAGATCRALSPGSLSLNHLRHMIFSQTIVQSESRNFAWLEIWFSVPLKTVSPILSNDTFAIVLQRCKLYNERER